jgi:drug/metabolite transporter (DMT)-like permease
MSRRGWALFLTLSVLWGLPYLLIRVAVRQLDPGTVVFARTFGASLILVPLAWRQRSFATIRGAWGWLALYSVVEMGVPWLCMSTAEVHITSSLTGLIVSAVPLGAIALTRFLHPEEHISRRRVGGLGVGFVGVLVLVGLSVGGRWPWIALMGVVVAGYATGPMIISLRLRQASGLGVVAASVGLVAMLYAPWGVTHWPRHLRAETLWSVAGLAVACTAAAFLVFFVLVREIGPSRTVVVVFLNTAVAVVLGTLGLHEPLTTGILIGFPLIAVGSVLATSAPMSQRS